MTDQGKEFSGGGDQGGTKYSMDVGNGLLVGFSGNEKEDSTIGSLGPIFQEK